MKKYFVLLCAVLVTNFSFSMDLNTDPVYANILPKEYKAEFVAHTSSSLLKINLADVYSNAFDLIEYVDLHQNATERYYFVAYGKKDGVAIVHMINASDEMAQQEYYPSRRDLGLKADDLVIDCHCAWIFCLPGGQGKFCGVALDYKSPCNPSVICKKEVKPKPIDGN